MRVLIIESDPASARLASEALRERGVETTIVEEGQEGMERARSERPDALVLSVELGERLQGGFSICNRIKKDQELKDIPLLLISAHASEETFEQHRKLRTRADGYLRKPFAASDLLESLEDLVPGISDASGPAPSGTTERFGWSGFRPQATAIEEVASVEDEPLFEDDALGADEDLDLEGLLGVGEEDEAWAAPVVAAPVSTPPIEPPPLPAAPAEPAQSEELARLRRELESTRNELDSVRAELDSVRGELASARKDLEEAGRVRELHESRLREALAAREEADRKAEDLRKKAQDAGALEEQIQGLQENLRAREAEVLTLRRRLEQGEQVRQRTQKALRVADELLKTIEYIETR